MSINETLIGQMITFALFVWFTMKFVWPVIEKTLQERQDKIADGLLAAERGHKELDIAQKYAKDHIHEAKLKASDILEQAKKQADLILEQAKLTAHQEGQKILAAGHREVEREWQAAHERLQTEIIELAVEGTERILERAITAADREQLAEMKIGRQDQGSV